MNQDSNIVDWNSRFSTQAMWTKQLRDFLIFQLGFHSRSKILEVGCGTGVILLDLSEKLNSSPVGIDISFRNVVTGKNLQSSIKVICSNVYDLPFECNSYDFVVCHYFLLWLKQPVLALNECIRVLKPSGYAIAFAEPDYSARIDYPDLFEDLAKLQTKSLQAQGVNITCGRNLPRLFSEAGFEDIQFGLSGFQIPPRTIPSSWDSEWEILEYDLQLGSNQIDVQAYRLSDEQERSKGRRVSWVPTFYAYGKKGKL
jgi:SAM-dependent methyltransferase